MELKHTPGPWEIGRENYEIISVGPVHASDGNRGYAWIEVADDDARLIAAAPELLEALQKYSLPIDLNNIALSCIEYGSEAVERELQRRAAIAKATGAQA